MATVNDLITGYDGRYAVEPVLIDGFAPLKRYIACATTNLDNGEYHKIMYVGANSYIKSHMATVIVEGAAETADLCFVAATDTTAASPTTLINDHDLNTDDTCNAGTEMFTDVAGYICVLANAALTVAAFHVAIEVMKASTAD